MHKTFLLWVVREITLSVQIHEAFRILRHFHKYLNGSWIPVSNKSHDPTNSSKPNCCLHAGKCLQFTFYIIWSALEMIESVGYISFKIRSPLFVRYYAPFLTIYSFCLLYKIQCKIYNLLSVTCKTQSHISCPFYWNYLAVHFTFPYKRVSSSFYIKLS